LMLDFVWGPQFNINGLVSGWTQPGPEWGLPMKAVAKCDIRLAPDMEMDDILAKLRKHHDNHGFSDIELRVVAGYNWSKWSQDDLIIKAAVSAAKQMDISYDITPSSGSCNPLLYLGLPCLYSGPGRAGRVHCQDEYITV